MKAHHVMLVLVFAWGLFSIFHGERIPAGNGLGYDGVIYADTAVYFPESVFRKHETDKRIQRFLPSAVVHYSLRSFKAPLTPINVVRAFQILNLALLLAAVLLYRSISAMLGLGFSARWIGFLGLFFNFANAKMIYFYPTLTDTAGFFLGVLLVYFFLKDSSVGLYLTALAGAFTWPSIPFYALFLIAFKKTDRSHTAARAGFPVLGACFITGLLFFLMRWAFSSFGGSFFTGPGRYPLDGTLPFDASLGLWSVLFLFFWVFLALVYLLNDQRFYDWRLSFKEFRPGYTAGMLALFWLISRFVNFFSVSQANSPMKSGYVFIALQNTLMGSVTEPLIFLLGHLVYYGPIVYLMLFYWKDLCRVVHEKGLGLTLLVFFSVLFVLPRPESRQALDLMPILVIFTAKAIDRVKLGGAEIAWFAALSIFSSKIWMDLNGAPDLSLYFMNIGPWMPKRYYILQGLTAVVVGVLFFSYLWFSGKLKRRRMDGMAS